MFCCRMPYSLLFVIACRRVAFVAACCTDCYLLLHAIQLAIWCLTPYSYFLLPHAVQFAICSCSIQLLFVAAHHTVVFGSRMPYSLLFVVAHCRVAFVAVCHTVCYLLPHAVQLLFLPHAVHFAICCSAPYSCYLLLYAVHFAICCHML